MTAGQDARGQRSGGQSAMGETAYPVSLTGRKGVAVRLSSTVVPLPCLCARPSLAVSARGRLCFAPTSGAGRILVDEAAARQRSN